MDLPTWGDRPMTSGDTLVPQQLPCVFPTGSSPPAAVAGGQQGSEEGNFKTEEKIAWVYCSGDSSITTGEFETQMKAR
jgi:hypothetical protein